MPWYSRWFNTPLYLDLYRHRDQDEAHLAVQLFIAATELERGRRILDLGCGAGRHSLALSHAGYAVTAMDLSPLLLGVARIAAAKSDCPVSFVRGDMRGLPFQPVFHGIAQLFTAFGYFPSDDENAQVISQAASALLPGGWYFLDFLNVPYVETTLNPRSESLHEGKRIVQAREITDSRVEKSITVYDNDSVCATYTESVRLYTEHDLATMLASNGFEIVHRFGDYRGMPLNSSSPRCILVGKRR